MIGEFLPPNYTHLLFWLHVDQYISLSYCVRLSHSILRCSWVIARNLHPSQKKERQESNGKWIRYNYLFFWFENRGRSNPLHAKPAPVNHSNLMHKPCIVLFFSWSQIHIDQVAQPKMWPFFKKHIFVSHIQSHSWNVTIKTFFYQLHCVTLQLKILWAVTTGLSIGERYVMQAAYLTLPLLCAVIKEWRKQKKSSCIIFTDLSAPWFLVNGGDTAGKATSWTCQSLQNPLKYYNKNGS